MFWYKAQSCFEVGDELLTRKPNTRTHASAQNTSQLLGFQRQQVTSTDSPSNRKLRVLLVGLLVVRRLSLCIALTQVLFGDQVCVDTGSL